MLEILVETILQKTTIFVLMRTLILLHKNYKSCGRNGNKNADFQCTLIHMTICQMIINFCVSICLHMNHSCILICILMNLLFLFIDVCDIIIEKQELNSWRWARKLKN